ncbi:type II secretion system F family protein [Paenibacillus alvei]|uniref:Type II secretion system F family protein n=1 Tax=Paenibacillus alvei TaxID=44250 RepID=A0ABT4GRC6_PAEAL|nr:type II secretion system F family protein [Paenibacillus alvei]EJW16872.1 type II secretion system protein F domain protein [Paenibacillus alvei DSM 29]MCY9540781.1 type II secretion system F family protein [Paenibacillus alvei]MCY9705198.1 type II secretion system F family protein [Paenibacillus alvei]MCY9733755.1 type II secretion system F family protein [Paenibacillus alvei]MCY9756221.1 type II secretion system F family protein [Paenibacillus alvei]
MLPTWIWGISSIVIIVLYVLMNQAGKARYAELLAVIGSEMKTAKWLPASLMWQEKLQPILDTHPALAKIRQALMQMHGPARSHSMYRGVMAEMGLYLFGGVVAGFLLPAVTDGSFTTMAGGMLLGVILPLVRGKEVVNKAERRRQDIQLELPELINKLNLLVQAGETVPKALATCIERKKSENQHPLYIELFRMMSDVHNGYSFAQAMELLAKRCSMQEVSMFVTTVLMNQRRGGETFMLAMADLGRQLWDKRKTVARKRGEELSTKLVFPMMLMFLVVLVVVGAPALLMMQG